MSATGHWNLVIKTPMGVQKMEADLSEDGGTLSGTLQGPDNPVAPIKDTSLSGNRLGWKFAVKKPFPTTLAFDVNVDGDAMTGTCKAGVFPAAPLTGMRG